MGILPARDSDPGGNSLGAELAEVARASGGPEDLSQLSVEVVYPQGVASATAGIWRYSSGSWSVILKLLRHGSEGSPAWQSGLEVEHWYYWRREAEVFASGLLKHLAPPLRAPSSFGTFERTDGSLAIWMEDLRDLPPASSWDLPRYHLAARHLGRGQGTSAREVPDQAWLARHWLHRYVERKEINLAQIEDAGLWRHPLVTELLPSETRRECRAIWEDRHRLLDLTDAVPLTLTHSDLHPGNIFGSDSDTVLVDWGFAGRGPLGEDPGNLVFDAIWDFFVPPEHFQALRAAVVDGYLGGLEDVGLSVDPGLVTRVISAVGAVKYFWIPLAMAGAASSDAPTLNRHPLEEAFRTWAPVVSEIFEARRSALGR